MTLSPLHDLSILVADDDPVITEGLERFLKNRCRVVYIADNGAVALKLYRDKKPDIFITDIIMPTLSGLDVVKRIRKDDWHTLIFVMTSEPDEEYLLESITLQLEKFILKPMFYHEMLSALEQSCKRLQNQECVICESADLHYCYQSKRARKGNQFISLTHKEILLLELLLHSINQVVSYNQIEQVVYEGQMTGLGALRMLVKRLKDKLPDITINSTTDIGYRLSNLREI